MDIIIYFLSKTKTIIIIGKRSILIIINYLHSFIRLYFLNYIYLIIINTFIFFQIFIVINFIRDSKFFFFLGLKIKKKNY